MKKHSALLATLSVLILLVLCAVLLLAAVGLVGLPYQVSKIFGPPAPGLSLFRRTYLAGQLFGQRNLLTRPLDPSGAEQPFEIQLGESTGSIVERLQAEGLVADADAFSAYLQYKALDTSLQAGEYRLSPAQTPVELAYALQDATPLEVTFRVLPGWRSEEIAAALPTSGLSFGEQEFKAAIASAPGGYTFSAEIPPGATLEGFLFPDSYRVARSLDAPALVRLLLDNFEAKLGPDLRQGFARQGLTIYQAVTLASIVQREAMNNEETPLIASVFYNRLAAGIKLDSDPTVQYALGFNGAQNTWWSNPLSLDDLAFDSPYNTYLYPGLPPGPISNPGLPALQAVAFPAQTPYFYFRAACDGSGKHIFAETFEEHLGNACP